MENFLENFNDRNEQAGFAPQDISSYKVLAVLGYIFPILFFVTFLCNKTSSYCRFHANQQLAWLFTSIGVSIVSTLCSMIPGAGLVISTIIGLVQLCVLVFLIVGVVKDMAVRIPPLGNIISAF